jgi:pyrimidine deaminase RibD-like protein
MQIAIEEMLLSSSEHPDRPDPLVGAVLVSDRGKELGRAHRGSYGTGDHGEFTLLEKSAISEDPTGGTIFVTLEPCTKRNSCSKVPCVERIIAAGITRVVIGIPDPNPDIYMKGVEILESSGIPVDFFDSDLAEDIKSHNAEFLSYWEQTMVSENANAKPLQTPSLEENQPVQGASTRDFSKKAIQKYLRAMKLKHEVPSGELWTYFKGAGFLKNRAHGKLVPTVAGMVLFGERPDRFLPQCKIKADAFSGTPQDGVILKNIVGNGQLDISGPLSNTMDAVEKFFKKHVASIPVVQGSIRRNVPEYPWVGAVREALVNALVHRDYRTSAAVFFRIFRDRIEIRSPGLLPSPLTLAMLPNDVTSVPRNPRIADAAFHLGYMEARGFGIPTMP